MDRPGHLVRVFVTICAVLAGVLLSVGSAAAQDVFSSGSDDYGDVFASNGDDDGGDVFSSNGGVPTGTDEFSSNSNGGGQTYPLPPLPCGMNALEGQAWSGPGSSTFLGMLSDLVNPACQNAFRGPHKQVQACHRRTGALEDRSGIRLAAFHPGRDEKGRSPLIPVQAGSSGSEPGLWVGGAQVWMSSQLPGFQAFLGGVNTRGPYQRAHLPLRGQIFVAMACHPHRRFEFKTVKDLEINIMIRANSVVALSTTASSCRFPQLNQTPGIGGGVWETYPDPRGSLIRGSTGQKATDHFAFRSVSGDSATQAVDSFLANGGTLDCQLGLEASVLAGIRRTLGTDFDTLHRPGPHALWGLGIPLADTSVVIGQNETAFTAKVTANRDTSFGFHMVPVMFLPVNPCRPHGPWIAHVSGNLSFQQRPITAADMVPGDYAYLSNPPDYEIWHPGGNTNGENALYAGSVTRNPAGIGVTKRDYFVVHGLGVTEELELKDIAASAYNAPPTGGLGTDGQPAPQLCPGAKTLQLTFQKIDAANVHWTLLAGPTRAGDVKEAGPFVR
ncbi:MAG TPA: hypothetical protein VM689_20835 [Aliidongia sp.]|nr:hypothetical protein [Aliidongia sp.]